MPPATPGRMAPGLHSSIVSPSVPSVSSRYATCGCAIALSTRCCQVIAHEDRRRAGRVQRLRPAVEAGDGPAVELADEIRNVVRDQIDERRSGAERFLLGVGPALDAPPVRPASTLRFRCVARVRRVRRDVRGHLLGHRVVDLFAVAGDRMRGADVRPGRHGRNVGRDRDQEAGRRGAVARWADENRDRGLRADDGVVDVAGRIDQAARRAQREDDERGAGRVRLRDRLADVFSGDGMDDPVDFGGVDRRRRAGSAPPRTPARRAPAPRPARREAMTSAWRSPCRGHPSLTPR